MADGAIFWRSDQASRWPRQRMQGAPVVLSLVTAYAMTAAAEMPAGRTTPTEQQWNLQAQQPNRQFDELERLTVVSNGHPLRVWARRPANPRGAVLLVHGRTWSGRPGFDLQVPGLERSVLASLTSRDVAAYAVDLRGYGETPRDPTGWTTPEQAAGDLMAVMSWIAAQHAGLPPPTLVGWSRGAAVAMLAAQRAPALLSSLVLYGFSYDPDQQFASTSAPERPAMVPNSLASAQSDFISPEVTPRAVVDAFGEQAVRADPVLADWREERQFNALDPALIRTPVLVLAGQRDPVIVAAELTSFFRRLGAASKRLVLLPGADHAAHLEDTHTAWISAVVDWVFDPRE